MHAAGGHRVRGLRATTKRYWSEKLTRSSYEAAKQATNTNPAHCGRWRANPADCCTKLVHGFNLAHGTLARPSPAPSGCHDDLAERPRRGCCAAGWLVWGVRQPTTHEVPTADALGTSARQFYTMLTAPSEPAARHSGYCWADAPAGGERIIIINGAFVWQEWLDAASDSPHLQKGVLGSSKGVVHQVQYDTSKSARVLGMTYRTMQETVRDTVADWEARGWLNAVSGSV
ncbi:hypothetical protein GGX14DRAFT_582101 [Mycena pura]|uniref:Uncharacterized protein n=1 Tax=Mycena pura TaxID=153505 RepID=A0AAD6YUX7_9AGAR|nr:hypothetical protein GGX14DRAFT_582101 [Mycena pura]